jgi:hypothetical protein
MTNAKRKVASQPSNTPASFSVADWERQLITSILDRANKLGLLFKNYPRLMADMDLCAANGNNGNRKLDLERLLVADDFNFTHDICGIARHMNRTTGRLGDHFVPRFTVRTSA